MVLFFGLLRPYKGVDTLLRGVRAGRGRRAVGRRHAADADGAAARAGRARGPCRFVAALRRRRRDPRALPARRPRRASLPRHRPVRRALHRRSPLASRSCSSAVGGFAELGREHGAARLVPPGDPAALAEAMEELLADPAARAELAAAAARAAAGPYSWDAVAAQTLELYRRAAPSGDNHDLWKSALLGLGRRLLVYTHVGYPLVLWLPSRARAAARGPPPRPTPPSVSLIVAAYDEEEVIAAKVANALALDYPRELLEVIVASDGSTDRPPSWRGRPAPTPCSTCRAAARPPHRTRPPSAPRGEILAFSDANSLWAPDALRALVAPFADPRVGYVCGQVRFTDPAGEQPGGRLLALRDGGALARVGARRDHRRQRRRSTRSAATPTCRCGPPEPRPLAPVRAGQARPARASTPRRRGRRRRWSPRWRASSRRKRRMMAGLWDIVLGEGMLSPRGYRPLFALRDRLAPAAALRVAAAARARARAPTSRCSATAGLHGHPRAAGWRCSPRRCWRRSCRSRRCGLPLLRAGHRLDRGSGSGTGCARARRRPGRRPRARVSRRRCDELASSLPLGPASSLSPLLLRSPRVWIRLEPRAR